MSQKILRELDRALGEFENDPAALLIIQGGGHAFCAGHDLQPTQQAGSGFTVTSDRIGPAKNGRPLAALMLAPEAEVLGFRAMEQSSADLDCIAHQTFVDFFRKLDLLAIRNEGNAAISKIRIITSCGNLLSK